MHVPLARKRDELALRERRIGEREHDGVEGEIPGGVPGILPRIRHRQDVVVVEVDPIRIAPVPAFGRRRRLQRVPAQPVAHDVEVELFVPEHPGQRATLNRAFFVAGWKGIEGRIKVVGLRAAFGERRVERIPKGH